MFELSNVYCYYLSMNSLSWSKKSLRQLRKLPGIDSKKVYQEAQALKNFPECRNVKKLTNHEYDYRLRVGSYRIMFDYDGEVKIVSIEEVKKRDGNTY